jgi:general secretion pathway protein C
MNKISKTTLISVGTKLLILALVAKVIAMLIFAFLPSQGIELSLSENYKPKYQRVDFKNMIGKTQKSQTTAPSGYVSSTQINSMVLKGLYGNDTNGFVIIALKSSPDKTSIISIDESFSGYKLISILQNGAVFTKGSKEYILKVKDEKIDSSYITPVESQDGAMQINKSDLSFYTKDPKRIWRDISISEVKNGSKIDGFKITSIKKNTKIAKLGLKKGDIIIKANNIELKSYRDAFGLFNDIQNIDTMQIVVLRNNQEKEFIYEIN